MTRYTHVSGNKSTLRSRNGVSFLKSDTENDFSCTDAPLTPFSVPSTPEGVWPEYLGKERGLMCSEEEGRRGTMEETGPFVSYISAAS